MLGSCGTGYSFLFLFFFSEGVRGFGLLFSFFFLLFSKYIPLLFYSRLSSSPFSISCPVLAFLNSNLCIDCDSCNLSFFSPPGIFTIFC